MKKELFIALSMLVASTSIYASTSSNNSWSGFGETTSKIKKADKELVKKEDNSQVEAKEAQENKTQVEAKEAQENKTQNKPITKETNYNNSLSQVSSLDDNISSATSTIMRSFSLLVTLIIPLLFLGLIRSVLSGGR